MASSTPHLLSFPSELIVRILQHLDYISVHNFELTSRQSHEIVNSNLSEMPKFETPSMNITFKPRASDENNGGSFHISLSGPRRFARDTTPDVKRVVDRIKVTEQLVLKNFNPDILSDLTPVINGPDVSFFKVIDFFYELPVEALVPIISKLSCTKLELSNVKSLPGTALTLIEKMPFVRNLLLHKCNKLIFDNACLAAIAAKSTEKMPFSTIAVDNSVTGTITSEAFAVFMETTHFYVYQAMVNLPRVVGAPHRDALVDRLRLYVIYEDSSRNELAAIYKRNIHLHIAHLS